MPFFQKPFQSFGRILHILGENFRCRSLFTLIDPTFDYQKPVLPTLQDTICIYPIASKKKNYMSFLLRNFCKIFAKFITIHQ